MPAALIAVINRDDRRIFLDPAFRIGDSVSCEAGEEVRLLRTSQSGHMETDARDVATMLRRAGWRVKVRNCSDLHVRVVGQAWQHHDAVAQPSPTRIGHDLLRDLGEVKKAYEDQTKSYKPADPPPPPPLDLPSVRLTDTPPRGCRYRCQACAHVTFGRHVASHIRTTGHNDWVPVKWVRDTYLPLPEQAWPSGLTRSASSASEQRANVYTHPEPSAALQRPPDGSAS